MAHILALRLRAVRNSCKQRSLVLFTITGTLLILLCLLRLIPGPDDSLAGRPQHAKALTTIMAQEFDRVAQDRFPVIFLEEDEQCGTVLPAQITDDQIEGVLYVLTYSERQRFSCVATYAVPVDPSKFDGLRTIAPGEGQATGPKLSRSMKVLAIARNVHVYPPAYLESRHWRVTTRLSLSADQAANLAAREYESRNPALPPDAQAGITIDFD